MALFSTPSLLDLIWRRDNYPQEGGDMGASAIGGFAGLMGSGISAMKPKPKTQTSKSTANWGAVGHKSKTPLASTATPYGSGIRGGDGSDSMPQYGGATGDIPSTMAPAVNTPTVPQAGGVTSMLSSPGMEIIRRALYGING